MAAALNDLDMLVCDIEGAHLTAKCREKIWITAGVEFGSEAGQTMIVKMALCGLKSSGAAFRSKLAGVLDFSIGLRSPTRTCGSRQVSRLTDSNATRWC